MTELPIQGILQRILAHIERLAIPYMIIGGFAVRSLGVPRPTYDADLTIDASDDVLSNLFRALDQDGFMVPQEFRGGFKDTLHGMSKVKVQRFEERHVWDVDLFLVTTQYQRTAFGRRRSVRFLGADRWMITPEDLVLHKLLANRRKDLLDIEELLKLKQPLDLAYLRTWAQSLDLEEGLAAALREAGLA